MEPIGDDAGNMVVLEVLVVALIVLGSVVFVLTFDSPTTETGETRARLGVLAGDVLTVLDERSTTNARFRNSYLNEAVAEALHGDPDDIAFRVGKLLPPGSSFQLQLSNGLDNRVLYAPQDPPGETVSSSRSLAPGWSYTVLVPDFKVYSNGAGTPMNLTGVPVHRSNIVDPGSTTASVNFTNDHVADLDEPGPAPDLVSNSSIPHDGGGGDGYPVSGTLHARSNWTYRTSKLVGVHSYEVSGNAAVADTYTEARRGLNASSLNVSVATADPGDTVTITWNLSEVESEVSEDIPAGGSGSVTVQVLEPVQGLGTPTNWSETASWTGQPTAGSVDLDVPRNTLYGAHVVVAEIHYPLDDGAGGSLEQVARLVNAFEVGLEGGSVPPDPVYQLSLTAWYDDWN